MFNSLYSDTNGKIFEDKNLGFLGRSGLQWVEPEEGDLVPLPEGSSLVMMSGHYPVGLNSSDEVECRETTHRGGKAVAVACLLPQGFTRTLLPATVVPQKALEIPILGYTAVASGRERLMTAAIPTDEHHKWHPEQYNVPELEHIVRTRIERCPDNRILRQLGHCSLGYSCFTAQNIFYRRWEAGIPTTPNCNASCLGCISRGHSLAPSPQERLEFIPEVDEIVEVALPHLSEAPEGIISFGQGCEGDPTLNADLIASAISILRASSSEGCINLNTNAGYTMGVKKMVNAGLDAIRVTLLSAVEKDYLTYHQPAGYSFKDVLNSISYARDNGVYVSFNLLTMPGFTDAEEQVDQLIRIIQTIGVSMIQLRNLNIDPELFFTKLPVRSRALGVRNMIDIFTREGIKVASYTHPARKGKGLVKVSD